MGAYRNMAVSELNIRGISINPDASNVSTITVVASDSGVMFMNWENQTTCVYTLPAVADAKGKMFWFFNAQTGVSTTINAPTNTMVMENNAAASTAISAADVGDCGFVVCDGINYYFFAMHGTWANASG